MKKMLILAMAVFALMACNKKDESGMSKAEKTAIVTTTAGAIDALGSSPAEVDAMLTKAGYRKIDTGFNPLSAPVKKLRAMKADKGEEAAIYVYGLPEGYETMTEEQAVKWLNEALADDQTVIMVNVVFTYDKLTEMASIFLVAYSKHAADGFTTTSSEMYDKLPSAANGGMWYGIIANLYRENEEDEQEYTDHAKFVSTVSKAEGIMAYEAGAAYEAGFAYGNTWVNPGDEVMEEMEEIGLTTPFCYGYYYVSDGMAK